MQNQTLVDRILSALRELREAETEILGLLEELLSDNQNDYPDGDSDFGDSVTTVDGFKWYYTSLDGTLSEPRRRAGEGEFGERGEQPSATSGYPDLREGGSGSHRYLRG